MSDYARDASGRWLSSDERVKRYQAQHPSQPKKASEPPRKLTSEQITKSQEAKRLGKAEAAEKFKEPQSPNHYARQAAQLKRTAATRYDYRQIERFERLAEQWELDNAERLKREAIAEAKRNDPAYKNAMEHSDAFLRTVSEDFLGAANNARGYLEASGDFNGYWTKVADIETEVWAIEDVRTTELAMKANVSMSEFKEQCDKTTQAAERLRGAQSLTGEDNA